MLNLIMNQVQFSKYVEDLMFASRGSVTYLDAILEICNTDDEKSVNWVVEHFFEREDVGVTHPYVRRQLNQSQAMRNRMRGVSQASWEVLTEDGEKFWKSLPSEKKYKHKKSKELLIIPFRRWMNPGGRMFNCSAP